MTNLVRCTLIALVCIASACGSPDPENVADGGGGSAPATENDSSPGAGAIESSSESTLDEAMARATAMTKAQLDILSLLATFGDVERNVRYVDGSQISCTEGGFVSVAVISGRQYFNLENCREEIGLMNGYVYNANAIAYLHVSLDGSYYNLEMASGRSEDQPGEGTAIISRFGGLGGSVSLAAMGQFDAGTRSYEFSINDSTRLASVVKMSLVGHRPGSGSVQIQLDASGIQIPYSIGSGDLGFRTMHWPRDGQFNYKHRPDASTDVMTGTITLRGDNVDADFPAMQRSQMFAGAYKTYNQATLDATKILSIPEYGRLKNRAAPVAGESQGSPSEQGIRASAVRTAALVRMTTDVTSILVTFSAQENLARFSDGDQIACSQGGFVDVGVSNLYTFFFQNCAEAIGLINGSYSTSSAVSNFDLSIDDRRYVFSMGSGRSVDLPGVGSGLITRFGGRDGTVAINENGALRIDTRSFDLSYSDQDRRVRMAPGGVKAALTTDSNVFVQISYQGIDAKYSIGSEPLRFRTIERPSDSLVVYKHSTDNSTDDVAGVAGYISDTLFVEMESNDRQYVFSGGRDVFRISDLLNEANLELPANGQVVD